MGKIKTNKYLIISVIICIIILIILLILNNSNIKRNEKEANNKLIQEIKKHYSENVITSDKTNLYCENKKICGAIEKNIFLVLEQQKIDNIKDQYFKIKDTNYYIYYQNIRPNKEIIYDTINDNYVPFNFDIKTNTSDLYKDNIKKIIINESLELEVKYMDDNYYYILYMNNVFGIKKDSVTKIDKEKGHKESTTIPVLYFEDNNETKLKEKINYLKENNYYTINIEEYNNWLNKNIRLKEKAILLLSNKDIEIDNMKINNNTLKLQHNNVVSNQNNKDNISNYIIKTNTTMDNYKKMVNGEKVIEYSAPVNKEQKIAVLNYHFFYNPDGGEICDESICLSTNKFEQHLKYLKENGYKTLTMEEFRAWMYKEIELPKKSVLITIDDGAKGTGKNNGNKLIPLLEKYNLKATLFLITGWWDISNYKSPNLDVESHTFDMHMGNKCNNNTIGAQLLCSTKEEVMIDLKKSIDILKSNKSFCYPFYMYNKSTIENVKEAGFKLAFAGGNYKASRLSNKYVIPRYPIYKNITMDQFINMVN